MRIGEKKKLKEKGNRREEKREKSGREKKVKGRS